MIYSHILWDFNGTLLNDVETGVKSANVLLSRRNKKTLENTESYREKFCFPITEYYKNLGLDLEEERFDDLAKEWMEQYLLFSQSDGLFDGIIGVLEHIKKLNIPQIILSATEKEMLAGQLSKLGIIDYFDEILGLDNINAHSKKGIAQTWVKREKPGKALMIGDTAHDYEVSYAIGADCILFSNGHQSKEVLQKTGCEITDDLKTVIERLV